jgi:hypothetical protein
VLLTLVRSEVGPELLTRVSSFLLADRASVLRQLIRTVMAVDVEPASKRFAAAGVDPATIPASLNVPSGPSWHRLILWLLSLGETLAVEWARSATATPKNEGADEDRMREQALVSRAMIAMRDGDAELRALQAEWARSVFAQALQIKEDLVHR